MITEHSIINKINNIKDLRIKKLCVNHYETYIHKWAKPEILFKLDYELNQIIHNESNNK